MNDEKSLLISVITVSYNAVKHLPDTINSIRTQDYSNIEWVVIDGGSLDGTLELLKENEDIISCLVSEPDNGMYDALAKGFEQANGDVICWLNAGDIFLAGAISVVSEVFEQNPMINWITGMQFWHLPGSRIINCFMPIMFSSDLVECGSYGKKLPFIQQESTFFRRPLLSSVNIEKFRSFKLAGDLFLWTCFAKENQLKVIGAGLGSFCIHDGQLSEDQKSYWLEAKTFLKPMTLGSYAKTIFQLPLQYLPRRLKKIIAGKNMLLWKKGVGWK